MDKKNKLKFLWISLGLALTFLLLSFYVNKDIFRSLDYNILLGIQSLINRSADLPFSILTLFGSSEVIMAILSIIFIAVYFWKRHLFTGIFLISAVYIIELAGKLLIYHPKPPSVFNRYALDIFFPSSFIVSTSYSFPSGHVARTTFLAILLCFLWFLFSKKRNSRIVFVAGCAIFLSLVFVSRIYLAEHWLTDVAGGLLLGSSIAMFAITFW